MLIFCRVEILQLLTTSRRESEHKARALQQRQVSSALCMSQSQISSEAEKYASYFDVRHINIVLLSMNKLNSKVG